jgi:hypothetical protein
MDTNSTSAPTHGIASGSGYSYFDRELGQFIDTGCPMLQEWGTEEEMMDKLTDPTLPRQYCRNLGIPGGLGREYGYYLVELKPGDVEYEIEQREREQREQRAHSWAM